MTQLDQPSVLERALRQRAKASDQITRTAERPRTDKLEVLAGVDLLHHGRTGMRRCVVERPDKPAKFDHDFNPNRVKEYIEQFHSDHGYTPPVWVNDSEGIGGWFGAKLGIQSSIDWLNHVADVLNQVRASLGIDMLIGHYAAPFMRAGTLAKDDETEVTKEVREGYALMDQTLGSVDLICPNVYPRDHNDVEVPLLLMHQAQIAARSYGKLLAPLVNWNNRKGGYIGRVAYEHLLTGVIEMEANYIVLWNREMWDMKLKHRDLTRATVDHVEDMGR